MSYTKKSMKVTKPTKISSARLSQQLKHISQTLLSLNASIAECGMTLKLHTDFDLFREVATSMPERGSVTTLFNPMEVAIGPENGFWIEGTDKEGKTVHVQAMRMDDLASNSLAEHWQNNPRWYAPPGIDVDLANTNFNTADFSHKISGTVCYHGDFWIHKNYRKFRIAGNLSILAMLTATARFNPDYLYCFIIPKHIKQGLAAVYGYLHIHPYAPQWRLAKSGEVYDDYLVWITGEELTELWASSKRDTEILGHVRKHGKSVTSTMKFVASY
jgi:hypothetical protein